MSERAPFFSVIVPANNAEGYIRKGLESIRNQDFRDYELIVVCDSCTDDTKLAAVAYTDKVICTELPQRRRSQERGTGRGEGRVDPVHGR